MTYDGCTSGAIIYTYVGGNPIGLVDSTGEAGLLPALGVGFLVGGLANVAGTAMAGQVPTVGGFLTGGLAGTVAVLGAVAGAPVIGATMAVGGARALLAAVGELGVMAGVDAIKVKKVICP